MKLLLVEDDRIVRIKGASQVALITGEEKIAPPAALKSVRVASAARVAAAEQEADRLNAQADQVQAAAAAAKASYSFSRAFSTSAWAEASSGVPLARC